MAAPTATLIFISKFEQQGRTVGYVPSKCVPIALLGVRRRITVCFNGLMESHEAVLEDGYSVLVWLAGGCGLVTAVA
jgi:hypothetical protein